MKYLFLTLLGALIAASVMTWRSMPELNSPVPIIYWVTDPNPAREDQIHIFHLWQVKAGYKTEMTLDSPREAFGFLQQQGRFFRRSLVEINPELQAFDADEMPETVNVKFPLTIALPKAEMRLDTGNVDLTKRIIQGVSGVGGDVMDMFTGSNMQQLQSIGLLRDVTEDAKRLNYSTDRTWAAALPEIAVPNSEGEWRQYAFPCNVSCPAYLVNLEQIEKVGMPPPPLEWSVEEFEAYGREYARRANAGLARPKFFLVNNVDNDILRRSYGASELNETMTECTIDDPRAIAAIKKVLQWQQVDRIVPSAVDRAGFSTDSGYLGGDPQLFNAGNYALLLGGRYVLIQLRKFNIERVDAHGEPMHLGVSHHTYGMFPNTNIGARSPAVYSLGKHQDLAMLFQAYLASEDYNMQVIRDADALPPNPDYAYNAAYEYPAEDPAKGIYARSEYKLHIPLRDIAYTHAIARTYSPFVLHAVTNREVRDADDAITNQVRSPEEAYAIAKQRINDEIQRNLREKPNLVPLYNRKLEQQKVIDAMKQRIEAFEQANPGKPVPDDLRMPLDMIDNTFHRAFYKFKGWIKP